MSKKKSEQEIEEAQQKFRGEDKKKETPDKKQEKTEEPQKEKAKETKTVEDAFLETEDEVLKKPREIIDLEAITRKEPVPAPTETRDDYVEQLKTRPVTEIYNEIKDIYRAVEEKWYFSPTEERKVEYIRSEIESRFEDETYSFTEETARAASISHMLSTSMMYKGKKMGDMYKH